MDDDCLTSSTLRDFFRKNQFVRFLCVGAINTVFGYSLFALFIYLGLDYILACLLGTSIGILFNFRTLGMVVFQQAKLSMLGRFISVYIITYLLSILIIKMGTYFSSNYYLLGAIGLPMTAMTGYLLNKHLVFQRTEHEAH